MAVTLRDVARQAGVSVATASRVINNDDVHRVTPQTARRVLEAAAMLNYSPNTFARGLRRKQERDEPAYQIGVLLTSATDSYDDAFFYDILSGIQAEAAAGGHGIRFSIALSDMPPAEMFRAVEGSAAAGLILLGRMSASTLRSLQQRADHIVYAGLNTVNQNFDEVVCDAFACAKAAVRHLASLGRKRIGYVGTAASGGTSVILNEHRFDGYVSALQEMSLPLDRRYVVDTPLNSHLAFQATDALLSRGDVPDAFFCANDYCAIGVLKALRLHRLRVPRDVALISIDDIEMARYSRPTLSTIHIPRQDIGRYSVRLLIDQLETNRNFPIRMQMPFRLIVRESCGGDPYKKTQSML